MNAVGHVCLGPHHIHFDTRNSGGEATHAGAALLTGKRRLSYLTASIAILMAGNGLRGIPTSAAATDVLLFRDDCNGFTGPFVVTNPDGSGRRLLPPIHAQTPDDLSRGAPAMDALAVARNPDGTGPLRLFALTIDRASSGQIVPGPAWRALDDSAIAEPTGIPPGGAVFRPGGEHIVFIGRPAGSTGVGTHVYIADVVRDADGHAASLAGLTFVLDLRTLGVPGDSSHPQSEVGGVDLSPDGTKLLAVIYDDIWLIGLNPAAWVVTGATNLTRTPDFVEKNPRWSPAADAIAFTGGMYAELSGRWYYPSDTSVYTLSPSTGVVQQITTKTTHKGTMPAAEYPSWSPTGAHLVYSARPGGFGPRNSPCGNSVNYDLYRILATGTQKTLNVTNTAGIGVEIAPRWGW